MFRLRTITHPSVRVAVLFLLYLGILHGAYQLERRTTNRFLDHPLTRAVTVASGIVGQAILPFPVASPCSTANARPSSCAPVSRVRDAATTTT